MKGVAWGLVLGAAVAVPAARAQEGGLEPPKKQGAEEAKQPAAAPSPVDRLIAAVEKFDAREDRVLSVHVSRRAAQQLGGAIMIIGGGAPQQATPFEGEVEAWTGPDGALVLTSRTKLPGFAIYRSGGRTISRVTYEGNAPSLGHLQDELGPLLEFGRILRWLRRDRAELEVEKDPESGRISIRGRPPRRLVRTGDGVGAMGMPTMKAKVLRLESTFTLSPQGELSSVELHVVRNSPMAGMMKIVRAKGGAAPVPIPDEDKEASRTVYRLEFDRKRPSPRAQEFRREVEKVLASKE